METLKINYNSLTQIFHYFKSIEFAEDLTFSQKRRLMRLNEELTKEFKFFSDELAKIADEHCEKDEEGNFIQVESGGQKIKEEDMEIVSTKLEDLYSTEVELHYQPFKLNEKYFDNLKCDAQTIKLIEENFLEE